MKEKVFSSECDTFGIKMDELIDKEDFKQLLEFLTQLEEYSATHDSVKFSPIFYFLGTGYSELAAHLHKCEPKSKESEIEYRRRSLFYYRKTLSFIENIDDQSALLHNTYTNYATGLDACGRVIEAIRIYRNVIKLNPKFGMAIGNYGRALSFYANTVNDSGHFKELHCYAYQAIKRALSLNDPNVHPRATEYFEKIIFEYENQFNKKHLSKPIKFPHYCLGKREEKEYRTWCLENHLFLNPLNDVIEQENAFAHDPLTIIRYTEDVKAEDVGKRSSGTPPKWFAMLNQLKEEYIYARLLCFEGTEKAREVHYADRNTKLTLASFDYANYSIRLEQMKSAFKSLFSIFDHVAFFINEFWELGFNEYDADAAHVFKYKNYPTNNVSLTALSWSYSEFYEKFGDADSASERDLKTLRNAMEHKFLKIHQDPYVGKLQKEDDSFYHISEGKLKEYTLRLLELAREFIMELVYAVGIEESKKNNGAKGVQLNIHDFDDSWKL